MRLFRKNNVLPLTCSNWKIRGNVMAKLARIYHLHIWFGVIKFFIAPSVLPYFFYYIWRNLLNRSYERQTDRSHWLNKWEEKARTKVLVNFDLTCHTERDETHIVYSKNLELNFHYVILAYQYMMPSGL